MSRPAPGTDEVCVGPEAPVGGPDRDCPPAAALRLNPRAEHMAAPFDLSPGTRPATLGAYHTCSGVSQPDSGKQVMAEAGDPALTALG